MSGDAQQDQEVSQIYPVEPQATIHTPALMDVILVCPSCLELVTVTARFQTRMIRDQDGGGNALALRTRAAKAMHTCGQMALGLAEGARER